MKVRRGIYIIISCVIMLSILLSGCSVGSVAERREDDSSTLYVGYSGSSFPVSFMPWLSRDGIAPTIAGMVYNTLFSYDSDTGDLAPLIAENWCYVDLGGKPLTEDGTTESENDYAAIEEYYTNSSEDYAVVRLELHDDVYWSDGEKLTVEDVYYSFDLATDYTYSNHAGALVWASDLRHESDGGELITQGMITADHPDLSGTYAISEDEQDTVMYFIINKTFDAVTTLFNSILILPEHIWNPMVSSTQQLNNKDPQGEFLEQYQNPIGSGAWILNTDETNAQIITLDRNPNYHLTADDGSSLYNVDKIKIMLYLDSNTAIFALRKGYIDVLDTAVSSNFISPLTGEQDILISGVPSTSVYTLVLNVNPSQPYNTGMKMLFEDLEFRKALALAVNQQEFVDKVVDGAGDIASAGLVLESNELIYEPDADILSGDLEDRLATANTILDGIYPDKDSEGYRLVDGERISFEVLTSPGFQDMVSYLASQFKEIGIEVTYKAAGSTPETSYLFQSNFDMTIQPVILSMSNAGVMYKSHFVTTERSSNYGKFEDETLTQMVEDMRTTLNQDAKVDMIQDLQIMVAEQYYKIPLYTSEVLSVARTDRFTGFVEQDGLTFFNDETLQNLTRVTEE